MKTEMHMRIRTSRDYDSQNPPDRDSISQKAPRTPPPPELRSKAEVRVSLVLELVSERVELCAVLRIVYLQRSFVSQRNRDF